MNVFSYLQASDGWTYYFKNQYNLVDRHVDKVSVIKPTDDEEKRETVRAKFKEEQMPVIMAYDSNKVFENIQ